jgi:hypothetical protein
MRTVIRDAAAALVTGLPTTGSNVEVGSMRPKAKTQLPCWLVRVGDESVEADTISNGEDRRPDLIFSGFGMGTDDVEAQLYQMALECEQAVKANRTLGGRVADLQLRRVEPDLDSTLQEPCGRIDLYFQVIYFTTTGDPGVTI